MDIIYDEPIIRREILFEYDDDNDKKLLNVDEVVLPKINELDLVFTHYMEKKFLFHYIIDKPVNRRVLWTIIFREYNKLWNLEQEIREKNLKKKRNFLYDKPMLSISMQEFIKLNHNGAFTPEDMTDDGLPCGFKIDIRPLHGLRIKKIVKFDYYWLVRMEKRQE